MLMISSTRRHNAGFGLIEILVTLIILLMGLLGLAGLLARSQQAEMESYQRVQALILLQDMVDRINANRKVASCYALTTAADGTPYLGTDYVGTPVCASGTAEQNSRAISDMTAWSDALKGAAELQGSTKVGALLGARGCIRTIATDTYMVIIAWQGLGSTAAPLSSLSCGNNLYGNEAQRRVVSQTLRIANLN